MSHESSRDSVKEKSKSHFVGRLSRTFNASGKLFEATSGSIKVGGNVSSVVPFADPPHNSGFVSGRGSIGYEPTRRISAQSNQQESTIVALRAVAKLNRNLKSSHHTKKSLQKLYVDRHDKVLEQYSIRLHNRKDTDDAALASIQNFPFFMICPFAKWYKLWQLFTLGLILYQSFQIPYGLGFGSSNSNPFPIPNPDHPKTFITNRIKILVAYMRGWFFLDLAACFPIDIVMYMVVNDSNGTNSYNFLGLLKAVRLPRLLRLARLVRILKILQIPPEWKRWLLYSRYAHLIRLISTIIFFFFIIHICACVWNGSIASTNWYTMFPAIENGEVSDYVLSFFFCLETFLGQTLDLHTQTEFIFSIILIFSGALLMAAVFGDIAVLLANFHEKQNDYKKKMESLFSSMSTMKLPLDLQNRISEFYQTMWETHQTLDGQPATLTSELSRNLATEVELFLRMDMINRVPIFHSCSKRVVQEIVMKLSMDIFLPGDYVVVRGEVAFEMYFVQEGICEVTKGGRDSSEINPTGPIEIETLIRLLKQGDFFGEIALLMQCKRTANVRAKTFAELCVLTRDVFESITERYVEDRERMEKLITEKYDPAVLQQIAEQRRSTHLSHDIPPPQQHTNPTLGRHPSSTGLHGTDRKIIMDSLLKLMDRVGAMDMQMQLMEARQDRFFADMREMLSNRCSTMDTMTSMAMRASESTGDIVEGSSSEEEDRTTLISQEI